VRKKRSAGDRCWTLASSELHVLQTGTAENVAAFSHAAKPWRHDDVLIYYFLCTFLSRLHLRSLRHQQLQIRTPVLQRTTHFCFPV